MTGSIAKYALILVLVALAVMILLGPAIKAAVNLVKEWQYQADAEHAMLTVALKAELRNNTIKDPYDPRWWGKKLTSSEFNSIEKAFNDWLADTEYDMMTEAMLYEALRQAGLNLTNLEDAVHAAHHLVNQGRTKPKPPEDGKSGD